MSSTIICPLVVPFDTLPRRFPENEARRTRPVKEGLRSRSLVRSRGLSFAGCAVPSRSPWLVLGLDCWPGWLAVRLLLLLVLWPLLLLRRLLAPEMLADLEKGAADTFWSCMLTDSSGQCAGLGSSVSALKPVPASPASCSSAPDTWSEPGFSIDWMWGRKRDKCPINELQGQLSAYRMGWVC